MPSGPGALDSNGIWQYGEADNPDGTASGLLNKLAASVSTAIGLILGRLGVLEKTGGLTLIKPTSVATATGVTLASTGKITLAGAAGVSINGCFSSAFDNYLIVIDLTHSTSAALTMKLRAGGTDSASSVYEQILAHFVTSGVTVSTSAGNASFNVQGIGALQTIAKLDVFQPALAAITYLAAVATAMTSATAPAKATYDGSYNATTAFDGITLTAGAGTLTGTIRIYGYNNG